MKNILLIVSLIFSFHSYGQIASDKVRRAVVYELPIQSSEFGNEKLIAAFYESNNYQLAWMESGKDELRAELFKMFATAGNYGMDQKNYRHALVQSLISGWVPGSSQDTIFTDLKITDAAIQFLSDIKNGLPPPLSFKGIGYMPDNRSIVRLLTDYCNRESLKDIIEQIEPQSNVYKNAKRLLLYFNEVLQKDGFSEVIIKSNKVETTNSPLVTKLFQLGITDSIPIKDQKMLFQHLRKAQKMFNVLNDGVLRTASLAALNVPVWQRREEVKLTINYIKWFESMMRNSTLAIVNIPSASFFLYISDTVALHSRVIAGKPTTPTPTLSSRISEVIVYPYWNVPYKIATRELLPSIKENIGFLEANDFQVLDKQGNLVDPYKVNWRRLNASYFPYAIRQSSGCDNALGVLKFYFNNPFSVYLHDTPGKGLFFLKKRFFSHGCMRLENAAELAGILLEEKAAGVDSLTKKCLKDQAPKTILLPQPLPLVVFYATAWYNELGEFQFFEDIYRRNSFEKPVIAKH